MPFRLSPETLPPYVRHSMTTFFPRQTVHWKLEEPAAFRRLTLSVLEMAVLTGVVLRLYRSLALTHGPSDSWLYLGGSFALGAVLLFGMATAHLGNYTIRQWVWRVPVFAALEATAEMLTSLALIAVDREPLGTSRAEFAHWPSLAAEVLLTRLLALTVYALVLAGIVQFVRYALLKREDRESTAIAIHEDIERQSAEHDKIP